MPRSTLVLVMPAYLTLLSGGSAAADCISPSMQRNLDLGDVKEQLRSYGAKFAQGALSSDDVVCDFGRPDIDMVAAERPCPGRC